MTYPASNVGCCPELGGCVGTGVGGVLGCGVGGVLGFGVAVGGVCAFGTKTTSTQ
jgi:hypothetical protein